jgi:hypothetical protein
MEESKMNKLLSRDSSEVERLLQMFDDEKSLRYYLDIPDFIDFAERIDLTIKNINKNNKPRLIVLETWLIIDFSLRHILRHGLEINKFCDDNFDILPQGFRDCLKILKDFKREQNKKPINPSSKMLNLPVEFKKKIIEDKEFLEKFCKYESEYYEEVNSSIAVNAIQLHDSKYRNVNEHWLNSIQNIDETWLDKAEKLNKVRNTAAHSFDEDDIYKSLGINGGSKPEKLKAYCINMLKDMIGLK